MSLDKISKKRMLRVKNKIIISNKSNSPIVCIYRSNKNIYVTLNDYSNGTIIKSFSSKSIKQKEPEHLSGLDKAKLVGSKFAELCIISGIKKVVFNKGCYKYSGRVKMVAESCRISGLEF